MKEKGGYMWEKGGMQHKQMIFKVMPPTWAQSAILEPLDHTLDMSLAFQENLPLV